MGLRTLVPYPVRRILNKYRGRPEAEYQALCQRNQLLDAQYHELAQFCDLQAIPCDASPLGKLAEADLRRLLGSDAVDRDWHEDAHTLQTLRLPEMTGGVNPGDQRAIYYLLRALRPPRVLEVGTHIGCSTVNAALALKRVRWAAPPVDARLHTVDIRDVNDPVTAPWTEFGAVSSPRQMIEQVGTAPFVTFQVADSLRYLAMPGESFDFIFLDGLHTAERVYQEVPLALRRLRKGGFLLLHDYFPELRPLWSDGSVITGPVRAVRRLLHEGARFQVRPLGALPWPTKLGSNVTSLALVTAAG